MDVSFSQRIGNSIREHKHEVIFVADSARGTPYILKAFHEQEALSVWFKLAPEDQDDPVSQGNKFSDAVSKAFGSQLFGHAMSYTYGLSILKENLALFEPISFIMSGADYAQAFATDLLSLQTNGSKVILAFESLPSEFLLSDKALLLQNQNLTLSPAEATHIVAGRLNETEVQNINTLTSNTLELFLVELHKQLGLPAPMRPSPDGPEAIPGMAASLPPSIHLQMLLRKEQYIEAFEVAVNHVPDKVPELLDKAGNAFLNRGLYKRFQTLLHSLPSEVRNLESILSWELRVASRFGESHKLKARVISYLNEHEAPDIRAQYATKLAGYEESFVESERAYNTKKTFLTLMHYGQSLFHIKPQEALEVYREMLAFSELKNDDWEKAQALANISVSFSLLGNYNQAVLYQEEALHKFNNLSSGDWQFRMHVLYNWAYARILIGETVGLDKLLRNEAKALKDAFPTLAFMFRSTLGDYYLSQRLPHEALVYYQENYQLLSSYSLKQNTQLPPFIVRDLVQCFLHMGDYEQATTLARKHYLLSKDDTDYIAAFNTLAYGIVQTFSKPEEAIELLEKAAPYFEASIKSSQLAQTCIYLAKAHLSLGDWLAAKKSLERGHRGLNELSETGFRLLAGPEDEFRDVFALWKSQDQTPLIMNFLGGSELILNGKQENLYPMWKDTLAIIAMNPEGIRKESLELALEKEDGRTPDVKAIISKLRKLTPISRAPYKLELPLFADFLALEQMLKEGRVRAALEIYRGPLLKKSKSAGIIEARETYEEMLRQAVLDSSDAEVLLSLSERLKTDLELWEATLAILPSEDPRRSVAAAKHKKLQEAWDF